MNRGRSARIAPVWLLLAAGALALPGSQETARWAQWGGPGRDFQAEPVKLATSWDGAGPRALWRRPLGDGTSGISVSGDVLYTMFRRGPDEVATAISSLDGSPIWEYSYAAPLWPDFQAMPSLGPHSTPLVVAGRVFTLGIRGRLSAIGAASGELLWSVDLWEQHGVEPRPSGYAASPLAYGDLIILPVGGAGKGVAAFRQEDGEPVWFSQDFRNGYGSPLLVNVDGQDQAVVFSASAVAGLAPSDGRLLWSYPHENNQGINASTPLWCSNNVLFISSAYGAGSRALRLRQAGGKTEVKEIWSNNRVQVHFGNAIRLGDTIVTSSGESGPSFLVGLDPTTGNLKFRQRGFSKASFVGVGDSVLILDEGGELALAAASGERLEILAQAQVLRSVSRTAPTLIGTTLFVRDREEIAALDLGN